MDIKIIVKLQFEGVHHWPECPIEDVSFLKDRHRHIFHITAVKSVTHCDRDVEIIMLKREILKGLSEKYPDKDLGRISCEQIAIDLIQKHDLAICEVLEDNENGAIVCK